MSEQPHPRLDALLDGELGPEDAARAEEHLTGCAACRDLAAATRALARALPRPPAPVPAGFAAATRARALGRRLPEAPLWWTLIPLEWRAGLAALLLLAAAAGVRAGNALASARSQDAELAAALAAPASDAVAAAAGAEVAR